MRAWHCAEEKGICIEAKHEAVMGSREIPGRERKAGYWILGGIDDALPVTSLCHLTQLSQRTAGSLWDGPRWQVDKGQRFLCSPVEAKLACLAQKLSLSYWHVTKSLILPGMRRRDGKLMMACNHQHLFAAQMFIIDWDPYPNATLDSTGCVYRLSSVLKNPLISCSTIHKVFGAFYTTPISSDWHSFPLFFSKQDANVNVFND